MPMEGFLLAISLTESTTAAKKTWQTDFVKFDDISAQLLGFTDRTQAEFKWKIHLKDADVAAPVPADPKHSQVTNIDETPHCFYVHEVTSCGNEIRVLLSAPDDETKKKWMKRLLQAAKDGPQPPRFSASMSPRSPGKTTTTAQAMPAYCFEARVTQVRLHNGGKHAEYMITCHVSLFSRVADRRLNKEWNVWHRFSEFDALNEALKVSLGAEKMGEIPFYKTHRDAIRSLFGWWSLDQDFLDHRRLQLDTFVTRLCAIEGAVDFFQTTSDENLKKFFAFDENCEDVDHSPRKTSAQPASPPKLEIATSVSEETLPADHHLRTSDMSPRDSDNNSASFSSAIMSPVATVHYPVAVSPAPSPSRSKESSCPSPKSEPVELVSADSPPANETRRSRKKGKNKGKEPTSGAAASDVEVVRQPAHTTPSSKNGTKGGH